LISSWIFFWLASGWHVILLLISTIIDWNAGKLIYKSKIIPFRRKVLFLSLFANLILLGTFKYLDFFIQTYNLLSLSVSSSHQLNTFNLVLPVGISFYTFQTMSYSIDIYREKIGPMNSFLDFACYAAFFPQLVAGPIVRSDYFRKQIKNPLTLSMVNMKIGITLIIYGLFKKMVIANNVAIQVDYIFTSGHDFTNFWLVWAGAFLFGIQIYADFSAYTDIARGSAKIFGIDLPENFKHPYFAASPQEFWKRWHISLSTWLRDYLYIPLGGSHNGIRVLIFSTMATMFLGGLWHGASWNFILWGLLHGLAIIIHKLTNKNHIVIKLYNYNKSLFKWSSIFVMQIFTAWMWLIFRVQDSSMLMEVLTTSLGYDAHYGFLPFFNGLSTLKYFHGVLVLLFISFHYISYKVGGLKSKIVKLPPLQWGLLTGIMLSLAILLRPMESQEFIYFRF